MYPDLPKSNFYWRQFFFASLSTQYFICHILLLLNSYFIVGLLIIKITMQINLQILQL